MSNNFKLKDQTTIHKLSQTTDEERFALIKPSLQKISINKCSWSIKIKKLACWIGIGICLKNCIINKNYHFHYGNAGHGSYLISCNGFIWSHSDSQLNSTSQDLKFTTNDIIKISYNIQQRILTFKKNLQQYSMKTIIPPSKDEYVACVNLYGKGDCVELINEIEKK